MTGSGVLAGVARADLLPGLFGGTRIWKYKSMRAGESDVSMSYSFPLDYFKNLK